MASGATQATGERLSWQRASIRTVRGIESSPRRKPEIAVGKGNTKKSGGILWQGVRVRYVFIYRYRYQYPVRISCNVLEVSPSGYYGFLKRWGNSVRQADLIARIREVHRKSRYTYGSRRIMHQLRKDGVMIGRYRVRRLMRLAGITLKKKRRYKTTTRSNHRYPVSPNLIERCFQTARPNMVWVSDITYIKTMEGWLYLAVVMDLYSRKIVGWALARNMAVEIVKSALTMAIGRRKPGSGLIHHSDRGIQYACDEYRP